MVEILDKGELACVDLKCGPTLRLTQHLGEVHLRRRALFRRWDLDLWLWKAPLPDGLRNRLLPAKLTELLRWIIAEKLAETPIILDLAEAMDEEAAEEREEARGK